MFGKINLGRPGNQDKNNNIFHKVSQVNSSAPTKEPIKEHIKIEKQTGTMKKNKFIKKDKPKLDIHNKIQELQGAKFRILNELLYTRQSTQSNNYFQQNRQDFQLYHEGYRHQTTKWNFRPVDEVIAYFSKNKDKYIKRTIVDLGCGQGFLYQELLKKGFNGKKIKSYDLVSLKPFITEVDIANLPLKNESVSACVFCLSLMGTNYLNFIRQACRVLKNNGELIISEVESRSPDWSQFISLIQRCNFQLTNDGVSLVRSFHRNEQGSRYFRTMLFKKSEYTGRQLMEYEGKKYTPDELSTKLLVSCKYKKR